MGDYVLSGGEIAALAILDSTLRLVPGVLGDPRSAIQDSFAEGMQGGLEHALYSRPLTFEGQTVPPELVGGNHKLISEWRNQSRQERTTKRRPDLES